MAHRRGPEACLYEITHKSASRPPGEAELYTPLLLDCFERGGWFMGVFEGEALAAVAVLDSKFIGPRSGQLQLKFMHVGRPFRGQGLGRALFEMAKANRV